MFYDNLKSVCEKKGVKITPLIQECNGSTGSISKWRNGAYPNSDIVVKVAMRLGVSTDFLLLGKEYLQPTEQLSQDKLRLLEMYDMLSDIEKGEILGELKQMLREKRNSSGSSEQPPQIQEVLMVARSSDNAPPQVVKGDFSDIVNAPDSTDDF